MADVPKDIMEAAIAALLQDGWILEDDTVWHEPGDLQVSGMRVMPVALALLSERERRTPDVVTDEWAEAYCALVNRHPDGSQTTFMSDGPVTITFREMAKREIAAMLAAAPSLSSGAGGGERG